MSAAAGYSGCLGPPLLPPCASDHQSAGLLTCPLTARPTCLLTACLQRDDAEAAKVYEDFVKEFAADDDGDEGEQPPQRQQQQQQRNQQQRNQQPPQSVPRGGRPFVHGGTVRPGSRSPAGPPAAAAAPKPGGRYMPPGMQAALGLGRSEEDEEAAPGAAASREAGPPAGEGAPPAAAAPKKESEPVFNLPGSSSKGKPRAIDALLANLKRCGQQPSGAFALACVCCFSRQH